MRIGVRATQRSSGGGRAFIELLAAALSRHQAVEKVVLFTAGEGTTAARRSGAAGGTGPWSAILSDNTVLPRAVRDRRIDVLLCPGSQIPWTAGTPTVFWPLTVAPFDMHCAMRSNRLAGTARALLLRSIMSLSCRRASGIIFGSHYARRRILSGGRLTAKPTTVVPASVSVFPDDAATSAAEAVLPWGSRPFFLAVSHMYPYKMLVETIEGFSEFVAATDAPHVLALAGAEADPPYAARVRSAVERAQIGHRVFLLGSQTRQQLDGLYRRAFAFVFSSSCENAASFAVIDALSYGLPIISSNMSSTPEVVGSAALAFDPRQPLQLADHMTRIADSPQLRNDLRARARAQAERLPSWDEVAEMAVMFCSSVLASSR